MLENLLGFVKEKHKIVVKVKERLTSELEALDIEYHGRQDKRKRKLLGNLEDQLESTNSVLHSSQVARLYNLQLKENAAEFGSNHCTELADYISASLKVFADKPEDAQADVFKICEHALEFVLEISKTWRTPALKLLIAILHKTDHSYFICIGRWFIQYALPGHLMQRLCTMIEERAAVLTSCSLRIWFIVMDGAHFHLHSQAPPDSPVTKASNLIELSKLSVQEIEKIITKYLCPLHLPPSSTNSSTQPICNSVPRSHPTMRVWF